MAGYVTGDLVTDLWWFIENVTDEDPTRSEQFFELHSRVREHQDAKITNEAVAHEIEKGRAFIAKPGTVMPK